MRRLLSMLLLAGAILVPRNAAAGIPFWWQSIFDTTIVLCPGGDVAFHGYVSRFGPVAGSMVLIDFPSCPAVRILPPRGDSYVESEGRAYAFANQQGRVEMFLRGGGVNAAEIQVWADGVPMRMRPVASFDQDGDLVVSAADEAIAAAKLGTADPTADFDRDLVVTQADLATLHAHRGHAAEMPTPAVATTWGRLKSIYR